MAYYHEMRQYLYPGVRDWVIDNRIFDNGYDIHRSGLLMENVDILELTKVIYLIPYVDILFDQASVFWLLLFFIAVSKRNSYKVFYLPFLFIYVGLFFTAPVSLFRYVYGVYLVIPCFFAWYMEDVTQRQ